MELLEKLGIDWRLLIAQLVNFVILLAVLHKFAYKPLLKLLQERSEKIEKSLADAKRIEENLAVSQKEQQRIIGEAEREASRVRELAVERAEKQGEELLERTRHQAEDIIAKSRQQIEAHKQQMVHDAERELAGLVTAACEKVLADVMDQNIERRLAEKTVREFV